MSVGDTMMRSGARQLGAALRVMARSAFLRCDGWSRARIEEYHDRRLRALVRSAGASVPFYRELYRAAGVDVARFRGLEDLHRLPVVTRDDLQAHGPAMVRPGVPRWFVRPYDTGGTTGGQVATVYCYRGLHNVERGAFDSLWDRPGVRPGDRMARLRGELLLDQDRRWHFDTRENALVLSFYWMDAAWAAEQVRLMKEHRVRWIHAYPSAAWLLASVLRANGLKFDAPVRGLLLGSESFSASQAEFLSSVFGCPVYGLYGHREMCALAGWCEKSTDYHFLPMYGHVEFRPAPGGGPGMNPGAVEIVGTGYLNGLMPLIRYATGDLAEPADPGACPACGREHTRVKTLLGREQNFLVAEDGSAVPCTNIELYSFGLVARYQFHQEEKGRVLYRFVPVVPADGGEVARRLKEEFQGWGRLGLHVDVQAVTELPRTRSGKDILLVRSVKLPWEA